MMYNSQQNKVEISIIQYLYILVCKENAFLIKKKEPKKREEKVVAIQIES